MTASPAGYPQPAPSPYPTDPADAPAYGVSFGRALVRFFQRYARFTGRASLSEFWWMMLWNLILGVVISIIAVAVMVPAFATIQQRAGELLSQGMTEQAATNALTLELLGRLAVVWVIVGIVGLALIVPHIALTVRRLHDTNRSGHFAWLMLVPWVGQLIVLILCILPTDPYGQRFDRPLAA